MQAPNVTKSFAALDRRWLLLAEKLGDGAFFTLAVIAVSLGEFPKWFGSVVLNDQDVITYFRSVFQAETLIRSGDLFPRLTTVDYLGQGYPFFQFYPPVSFLFPAYIDTALNLGLQLSINVAIVILQVAACWAIVVICRQLGLNRVAAVLAAFAFLTYPYLVFDGHRGIPTFYAISFGTVAVAFAVSFLKRPSVLRLGGAILSAFLVPMTHVLSAVILAVAMPAFLICALPIVTGNLGTRSRLWRLGAVLIGIGLGFGLAAFQFEPILTYGLQKSLRISGLGTDPSWIVTEATQSTSLPNLLSPRISEGTHLPEPYIGQWGFQLGLPYVAGFLLGIERLRRDGVHRLAFAGIAAIFVLGIIATLPSIVKAVPGWYSVFQSPYRFLAATVLPGAVVFAYAIDPLCRKLSKAFVSGLPRDSSRSLINGLCAICVATIVAWSAPAWSDLNSKVVSSSGFTYPVTMDEILKNPVSTYSGDYLVNGAAFSRIFPDQQLLGNAQYFIYWNRLLSESNVKYPLPNTPLLPAGTRIVASGHVVDPLKPPVKFTIRLNDESIGTVTLTKPTFAFQMPLRSDVIGLRSISYRSDKSTPEFGIKTAVQFDSIKFEGLPVDRTAYYWDEYPNTVTRSGSTATISAETSPTGSIYVVPVLIYPGLQQVVVDGVDSDCIPVPRNDLIYCGVRATHPHSNISINFRGSTRGNITSFAALIASVVLLAMLGVTLRARRDESA